MKKGFWRLITALFIMLAIFSGCGKFIGGEVGKLLDVSVESTVEAGGVEIDTELNAETEAEEDGWSEVVESETETEVESETQEESEIESQPETGSVEQAEPEVEPEPEVEKEKEPSRLEVHFIDVGQGDATLLLCDGQAMLIDAGENDCGTKVQLYLQKRDVKSLDYVIGTHPDSDHIGGLDVVITKFNCKAVMMPDYEKSTATYRDVIKAAEQKSYKIEVPVVGDVYEFGGATFTIIAPNDTYEDSNNSSIGILLTHGANSFLFTGDAEEEAEEDILKNGINIDADVLHVGHHGSRTASTAEFVEAVSPEYAVISCGEGNSYGHPHAGPLNTLRMNGIKLFRTDEQGSIVVESDGETLIWNCAPTDSWQVGENVVTNVQKESKQESAESVQSEPEPDPEPEPQEQMVWKSATGKKYHSVNDCGNMNPNKAKQITKSEAEAMGLGQCSKCW